MVSLVQSLSLAFPLAVGLMAIGALGGCLVLAFYALRLRDRLTDARERLAQQSRQDDALRDSFKSLAGEVLDQSQQNLMRLAQSELTRHLERARDTLAEREKTVEKMVTPVGQTLQNLNESIHSVNDRLKDMGTLQEKTRQETQRLTNALRSPSEGGKWGEMHLKRVLEIAGLGEHYSYESQPSLSSGRPDLIIYMPGDRAVAVDAKTPFDAYDAFLRTDDAQEKKNHIDLLTRNVRARMRELAKKAYWQGMDQELDFTVLYIPSDGLYLTALQHDHELIELGVRENILFATPTTLIGILRAIEISWKQTAFLGRIKDILEQSRNVHDRLAVMAGHLVKLGERLDKSVDSYNNAIGSLDHNLYPAVRKFEDLAKKNLPNLSPIDTTTRQPQITVAQGTEQDITPKEPPRKIG
ncbi:MAG: DNA recombination protein RmuC [Pseudomonadota bacterium]